MVEHAYFFFHSRLDDVPEEGDTIKVDITTDRPRYGAARGDARVVSVEDMDGEQVRVGVEFIDEPTMTHTPSPHENARSLLNHMQADQSESQKVARLAEALREAQRDGAEQMAQAWHEWTGRTSIMGSPEGPDPGPCPTVDAVLADAEQERESS